MATVIDELVIRLNLDSKKVKKDVDKASLSFKKLFAIIGGSYAIKKFVTETTGANSALYRFAQNTGQAISQLSALSRANLVAGGKAGDLTAAISDISKAQTELKLTGNSSLIPFLNYLGISMTDATGKAFPATKMLKEMNGQFSKMDKQTSFNMGQMMGLSPSFMNLLLKTPKEFDKLIKSQKRYGALSKEQGDRAEKLRASWQDLNTQMMAFGSRVLSTITPYLLKFTQGLTNLSDWGNSHGEKLKQFFTILAGVLTAVYIPAITRAAVATAALMLPFIAIGAVISGVSLAIDDLVTAIKGGKSYFNWSPGMKKGGKAVMDWLNPPKDKKGKNVKAKSSFTTSNIYKFLEEINPLNTLKPLHGSAASTSLSSLTGSMSSFFKSHMPYSLQQVPAGATTNATHTTNIGEVKVYTKSTDAQGIGSDIKQGIKNAYQLDSSVQ